MTDFRENAKNYNSAEEMADDYLRYYYSNSEMVFPINPFEMLKTENIVFSLRNFKGLEGVYIPAENESDIAIVGININRPITRQRFTAAHELCHHFRDYDSNIACLIGQRTNVERFADSFAAAVLMPRVEMQKQIKKYPKKGYVSFDGVLEIANFFGVSFEACVNRLACTFHVIDGNPDYGGSFRSTNPLVLGAKFETIDCAEVIPELLNLENEWKDLFVRRSEMKISEYIEKVFKLHHQLTVIHPFQDGNGRTLRAFMNLQLVASHISPLYIKAENKKAYIDALSKADVEKDYTPLYEFLFKTLLESSAELAG